MTGKYMKLKFTLSSSFEITLFYVNLFIIVINNGLIIDIKLYIIIFLVKYFRLNTATPHMTKVKPEI